MSCSSFSREMTCVIRPMHSTIADLSLGSLATPNHVWYMTSSAAIVCTEYLATVIDLSGARSMLATYLRLIARREKGASE
jgi:hypothetical protein